MCLSSAENTTVSDLTVASWRLLDCMQVLNAASKRDCWIRRSSTAFAVAWRLASRLSLRLVSTTSTRATIAPIAATACRMTAARFATLSAATWIICGWCSCSGLNGDRSGFPLDDVEAEDCVQGGEAPGDDRDAHGVPSCAFRFVCGKTRRRDRRSDKGAARDSAVGEG